jgi:hypothetical protein
LSFSSVAKNLLLPLPPESSFPRRRESSVLAVILEKSEESGFGRWVLGRHSGLDPESSVFSSSLNPQFAIRNAVPPLTSLTLPPYNKRSAAILGGCTEGILPSKGGRYLWIPAL